MTARQFLESMQQGHKFDNERGCAHCGNELSESKTGSRQFGEGYADSDCYFDELSKVIEKNPIQTARIRRG